MKKYIKFYIYLILISNTGCREPYFSDIDHAEKKLVVDGLITDESNMIKVNLSNATPFLDHSYLPEIAANVAVSDDLGRNFILTERTPGNYQYFPFNFEYGRTYTLYIKLKSNKFYKSTPQTLFPKPVLDSVNLLVTKKTIQTTKDGKLVLKALSGLEFTTLLNDTLVDSPYFHFSNTVLVEYVERIIYADNPDSIRWDYHCWKKYFPNQYINLNEPGKNNLNEHMHSLAFCPVDTTYFGVSDQQVYSNLYPYQLILTVIRNLYRFAVVVKKYNLNADVHQYYKKINDQLQSNNRIFDPVSFQIQGNISCVNDDTEPVLGVFEVSSSSFRTFSFSDFLYDKDGDFKEIGPLNMEEIPFEGKTYNDYPSFWISQ